MHPTFVRLASATRQAAREALKARSITPAYPVIQKCPSPTCECADMPPDLDIEREKPLKETMAAHAEQLVIPSGQSDWASKIEDEKDNAPWGELALNVKQLLGRGGEYHDPYHNVAVNTCSFEQPTNSKADRTARALLFPSFRMVDDIKTTESDVREFVRTFLLPQKLHTKHNSIPQPEKSRLTNDTSNSVSSEWSGKVRPISAPTIMVCSHHTRDTRCGVLGPLLHAEFSQYINKRHSLRNEGSPESGSHESVAKNATARTFASHPEFRPDVIDQEKQGMHPINVGMISHVGGHKWAGNVIVYIPPDYCCNPAERVARGAKPRDAKPISGEKVVSEEERNDEMLEQERSPLAGKTVWYGRVEPKHVEGIVEQTIGHGQIIGELFRGGVNADGSYLRI